VANIVIGAGFTNPQRADKCLAYADLRAHTHLIAARPSAFIGDKETNRAPAALKHGSRAKSLQHSSHLEKRLDELAKRLRQKARGVPPGVEREELLRKAQAAEVPDFRSLRGDIVLRPLLARQSPAAKILFQTRRGRVWAAIERVMDAFDRLLAHGIV